MAYLTININKNSSIDNLVASLPDGKNMSYMVSPIPSTKIEQQIYLSNFLLTHGSDPFIETKFRSKFSAREKRLEVVSRQQNNLVIYKFSNISRYDRDAIDLQRIIGELKQEFSNTQIKFQGVILLENGIELASYSISMDGVCPDIAIKQLKDYGFPA